MIIWKGLGFVVAVFVFGCSLLAEVISEKLTNNDLFYQENSWVMSIGMLVAAILTFGFSLFLKQGDARIVIDEQTGEKFELRDSHSLFFVPVKWWPSILVVLGVVVLFVK